MRPLAVTILIFFAALFYTCAKSIGEGAESNFEVSLYQCRPVPSNNQATICFDSLLTDSRCPANAVCGTIGYAAVKFSLTTNGETNPFKLSTLDMPGLFPGDTIIAGYKIEFMHLEPYPGTVQGPIPDNARKAQLKVTKL